MCKQLRTAVKRSQFIDHAYVTRTRAQYDNRNRYGPVTKPQSAGDTTGDPRQMESDTFEFVISTTLWTKVYNLLKVVVVESNRDFSPVSLFLDSTTRTAESKLSSAALRGRRLRPEWGDDVRCGEGAASHTSHTVGVFPDSPKPDSPKLGLGVGVFPIRRNPIRRN